MLFYVFAHLSAGHYMYRYLDEGHTICTEILLSPDASPDEPHFDTAEG
jgi:hypothetical protein